MIRRFIAPLSAGAALLALAGCHQGGKQKDDRTATGKVLPGSISDAMIPYEALTSKPPLAPRVAAKAASGAESADSTADAAPEAEAAPAPAASSAISY